MSSLFSGLSGLTDKITSFIREPVSSLGNAINDAINATYGVVSTDKYMRVCLISPPPAPRSPAL